MAHWYGPCTWNNYPEDGWLQITAKLQPDWIIGQKEVAASGTPHLQFVLYFKQSIKKSTLCSRLPGIYYDPKPASAAKDLIIYVTKSETAVADSLFQWGAKPRISEKKEGLVQAFEETVEKLKAGDISTVRPEHQVKYWGNLLKIGAYFRQNTDKTGVRGLWIHGPPGSGKSHLARELAGAGGFYQKAQNRWWDLYNGERTVILDDLDEHGACLSHLLKIWLDRYAFIAEIKGGSIKPDYDRFIITSNYLPEELWPKQPVLVDAIRRRCEFREMKQRIDTTQNGTDQFYEPYMQFGGNLL